MAKEFVDAPGQQIYLGDDKFDRPSQEQIDPRVDELSIRRIQRRSPARSLDDMSRDSAGRNEAIAAVCSSGAYRNKRIQALFFDGTPDRSTPDAHLEDLTLASDCRAGKCCLRTLIER